MTTYPNQLLRKNSAQSALIKQVQQRLAELGLGSGMTQGVFDAVMESAVKTFQSRQVDSLGHSLVVDGIVGRFTWNALFSNPPQRVTSTLVPLLAQTLMSAISQIGVRETPGQVNRGPEVDAYLIAAGIKNPAGNPIEGYPWCQAFVYWNFVQASKELNRSTPAPKTAGVLDHWNRYKEHAGVSRITKAQALNSIERIQPGMVFIHDYGNARGHTGFVESVQADGRLITIEGNTNTHASAEGLGVYRLDRRKVGDPSLKGFIDYSKA